MACHSSNYFHIKAIQLAAVGCLTAGLLGCASLSGSQQPISADDINKSICPSDNDVAAFESAPAAARGQFRDDVLSKCIAAIDRNYSVFKAQLQQQAVETHLVVDILSVGLTAASSVSTGTAAKNLAAGAVATLGAGTAINKDIFYEQTLPAIESSMDGNRTQIQIRIIKSQAADPSANAYTLSSARSDINAYQDAGNLYVAISELTKTASQAASVSQDVLQATKVSYQSVVLDATTYQREKALTDDIRAYVVANDSAKVGMIATALGLSLDPVLTKERSNIIAEIDKRVTGPGVADPKKAIDQLSALLKGITGKDY